MHHTGSSALLIHVQAEAPNQTCSAAALQPLCFGADGNPPWVHMLQTPDFHYVINELINRLQRSKVDDSHDFKSVQYKSTTTINI
jgi:hypothetical protein